MTQTAAKTQESPNRRTASLPIRSKYDAARTTGNNRRSATSESGKILPQSRIAVPVFGEVKVYC